MRTDEFWALIDQARAAVAGDGGAPAGGDGSPVAAGGGVVAGDGAAVVADRITDLLAERDPADIEAYARHQRRVLAASDGADLWGAAYLINGGASDDGFRSFRGWLMAQGRTVFARAVSDPDSLAELPAVRRAAQTGEEFGCDSMLAAAGSAFRRVAGAELPVDARPSNGPDQSGSVDLSDFWDFDDPQEAQRRLPRLAALFVEPPPE